MQTHTPTVAGAQREGERVTDRTFYNQNYPLWFPEKKALMTLEYEHCGYNLIALAPKNYWCDDGKNKVVKLKGVSTRGNLNKHINERTFQECIKKEKIIGAKNYVLRMKDHRMTKQLIYKTGLSGVMTKAVVLPNNACLPFVHGIGAKDYVTEPAHT
jgi:hypothetical protein